jgi:GNAT superfamily N-acetyltransferase
MQPADRPGDRPAQGEPTTPIQIGPLRREQLRAAGEVFVASHGEYPPFRHVFPDPARRAAVLRAFFTTTIRDALAAGHVDAAVKGDRVLGVAVWLPPGAFPWSLRRQLRATPGLLKVLQVAPRSFVTFMRQGARSARLHPRDPHWDLETMGILPEAQGRGLGARLLEPGLARADQDGLPCYLTTARRENLAFYRRSGFDVEHDALPLVPGGPTHWGMRRPARRPAPQPRGGA